jgi:hypothetical protein
MSFIGSRLVLRMWMRDFRKWKRDWTDDSVKSIRALAKSIHDLRKPTAALVGSFDTSG